MQCKSCDFETQNNVYQVKEMYLGLREIFNYGQCCNCGCMQLLDIPGDLGKYYPPDKYYSFNTSHKKRVKKDILRKIKAGYILYGKNKIAGSLLSAGYKVPGFFSWLKKAKVALHDRILDVGCGDGGLLVTLYKFGFTDLTGVDPFNPSDYDYGAVKIFKKDIFTMQGEYDFIMLNHVFEHLDQPSKILKKLYELLKPQKFLLIRTPVMEKYSWNRYKECWMDLDAPRHLIVHTQKSMNVLAARAGFNILDTVFEGTMNTLIGSEQYMRDMPLLDDRSYFVNKHSALFSKAEIEAFRELTGTLNKEGQADQAAFFLYKP